MKFILKNIHTILLILGFLLITYSAFLFNLILGYFVGGLLLVTLAIIINVSTTNNG